MLGEGMMKLEGSQHRPHQHQPTQQAPPSPPPFQPCTEEATFASSLRAKLAPELAFSWAGKSAAAGQLGIGLDGLRAGGWGGGMTFHLYLYSVYFALSTLSSIGDATLHPWTVAEVGWLCGGGGGGGLRCLDCWAPKKVRNSTMLQHQKPSTLNTNQSTRPPTARPQVAWAIVFVTFNLFFLAYITGSITLVVFRVHEAWGTYRDKLRALEVYCRQKQLPTVGGRMWGGFYICWRFLCAFFP
jgi:hypothetical protein